MGRRSLGVAKRHDNALVDNLFFVVHAREALPQVPRQYPTTESVEGGGLAGSERLALFPVGGRLVARVTGPGKTLRNHLLLGKQVGDGCHT